MKKSLRPSTHGNESIFKKIKAKCEAKEKDKSSTLDTWTKSTHKLRSKKTNASNMQTHTETTLSSQMLGDLSYKEQSIVKASAPELLQQDRLSFGSSSMTRKSPKKRLRFDAPDLTKILEMKNKEIHYLENVTTSMNHEIEEAVEHLENYDEIADALSTKDRTIKELKSQLQSTLQEIEHIKLWKKSTSIPNIVEGLRVSHHVPQRKESAAAVDTRRSTLMKIKSLSPGFAERNSEKKTKYKMYADNPVKAILSKYSKATPKKMKEPLQRCSNPNIKKSMTKYSRVEPNYVSMSTADCMSRVKKSQGTILLDLKTPSPKKKPNTKLRDIVDAGTGRYEGRKPARSYLDLRGRKEQAVIERPDMSKEYTMLLDQYVSLVEDYKQSNAILKKRNEYLENQFRLPMEKLLNVSTVEY